jgi:hypothetical protein
MPAAGSLDRAPEPRTEQIVEGAAGASLLKTGSEELGQRLLSG